MGRGSWYKKWQLNKSFIIENDGLKDKSYVFTPFPRTNQYGFQDGDIRRMIAIDILARYLRMQDKNVLFPIGYHSLGFSSYVENKKLSSKLDNKIQVVFNRQLVELGVGINESKLIDMRDDLYISYLQNAFIELYERNYIEYKNAIVYYDEVNNKIYDSISKPYNLDLPQILHKSFLLNIEALVPQIIGDINALDCNEALKNRLIEALAPGKIMELQLVLSNGNTLQVQTETPELLGGVSFILLNPEYIDITNYVEQDEYPAVINYLEGNDENELAFCGIYAQNPLTGNSIPVFISLIHKEAVHLGIPTFDEDDRAMTLSYGFDIIEIINNNHKLINSDFLDGYTLSEANKLIFDSFIEAEIATSKTIYHNKYINLSSIDTLGPLFPFLSEDGGLTLNSLKNYLPLNFSSQFRPILSSNVNVSGQPLSGTMNNMFVEGLLPIISIIYDDSNPDESIFSDYSKEQYNAWNSVEYALFDDDKIYSELLMPIIFYNILKKEISYTLPNLFKKVDVVLKTLDSNQRIIKRANNNLVDLDSLLKSYYSDSVRLFVASCDVFNELILDEEKIKEYDSFIKRLEQYLKSVGDINSTRLDYHFYTFADDCKDFLEENEIAKYANYVYEFTNKYVFKEIISKKQLLVYLKVIYPLMPYLAEEIYEEIFNSKYSIVNESWPN